LHLNSTATGGGVAEILQSMVPLGNSLGMETERIVIEPDAAEFFQVTKKIHNMLQGAEGELSPHELDVYFSCIQRVADDMNAKGLSADVWFVHDPQLLPLAKLLPRKEGETWIWICHIDLTTPNKSVLDALMPLTEDYDRLIFSQSAYVPEGLADKVPVVIAPPAIDPLTIKNTPMDLAQAQKVVRAMGIDTDRPLITQVSRFDFWKDPWGVIDAYRTARKSVPGLQLALLGLSQATDDPEALEVLKTVS
jgi:trehalose synthase